MRNLIYQYWDTYQIKGIPPAVQVSKDNIKAYADKIGAEYLFELNPKRLHLDPSAAYHSALNPVFREEFHEYDNVLFLDADIYAVEGLEENIFEGFSGEIGICEEIFEPKAQIVEDKRRLGRPVYEAWAKAVEGRYRMKLPRTKDGLLRAFNSGVVVWSKEGLKKAKEKFIEFEDYITCVRLNRLEKFLAADQHYLNTCMWKSKMDVQIMDCKWNTLILQFNKSPTEILFDRNENTCFVHLQLRGMRWDQPPEVIWKIVNLPVEEWGFGFTNITEREKPRLL